MTESDVEKLLKAFHQENLEFVIIGGLAALLQGSAYVTADLDLCYSRKRANLEKLARALEAEAVGSKRWGQVLQYDSRLSRGGTDELGRKRIV